MPVSRMQQRRDTTARWASANPVLLDGELGYDTTLDRYKVGDGVTAWTGLPWADRLEDTRDAAMQAQAAEAGAVAARDTARDISNIAVPDDVMTAVGADPSSRFSRGQLRSQVATVGTSDSAALLKGELDGLAAFGGGTLLLPSGDIYLTSPVVLGTDGENAVDAPLQRTVVIQGQGGYHSGQVQNSPDTGGTILHGAKFTSYGLGRLEFRDIVFLSEDPTDTVPFITTTNTTVRVNGCAFLGAGVAANAVLDCIVLGGTKKPIATGYDDPDSGFQGYGSVIRENYFDGIRRAVFGRSYCNHVVVTANFVDKRCGSQLTAGACIEFNGGLDTADTHIGDYCTGDQVWGNYLNGLGYKHQIKLVQATRCLILGNGSPDPQPDLISLVGCYSGPDKAGVHYPSYENQLVANHCQQTVHLYEDTNSLRRNQLIGGTFAEGNVFTQAVKLLGGLTIPNATAGGFEVRDTAGQKVLAHGGSRRDWNFYGPLRVLGNTSGSGSTVFEVGDGGATADDDAVIRLRPSPGKTAQIDAGPGWLHYDAATVLWFMRDKVNARMHITYVPGASAAAADTDFNSNVTVQGVIRAKSPNGTLMQLIPPNGGGAATWQPV